MKKKYNGPDRGNFKDEGLDGSTFLPWEAVDLEALKNALDRKSPGSKVVQDIWNLIKMPNVIRKDMRKILPDTVFVTRADGSKFSYPLASRNIEEDVQMLEIIDVNYMRELNSRLFRHIERVFENCSCVRYDLRRVVAGYALHGTK